MDNLKITDKTLKYSTKKDLLDFKTKINNINAFELISEAINSSKNNDNKILKMRNINFLEDIENNAKSNYLELLSKKEKKEMEKYFINCINKFKIDSNLVINKKEVQSNEYKEKFNNIYRQNLIMNEKLNNYNNIFLSLENEIKAKDEEIINLKQKLELFKNNEKLLTSFYDNFHEKDPLDIVKSYKKKHQTEIELIEENNYLKISINNLNKTIKEEKEKYYTNTKILKDKIDSLILERNELLKNRNNNKFEIDALNTKNKMLEEKNKLMHKMLYQIYNKLIEAFKLEKNINLQEKYLYIKKEDFTPNIIDDVELANYIKIMIASSKSSLSDQLLRETVANANMIVRMFLRNKVNLNLRFDPVLTFRELKMFIEKREDKMKNLEGLIKKYKMLNSIENYNKKYESTAVTNTEEKNNISIPLKKSINRANSISIKKSCKLTKYNNKINTSNKKIKISEDNKTIADKKKLNYDSLDITKQALFNQTPKLTSENNSNNLISYTSNEINARPKSSSPNIKMYKYKKIKPNIKKVIKINYKDTKYQLLHGLFVKRRNNNNSNNDINNKKLNIKFIDNKYNIFKENGNQEYVDSMEDLKKFIHHTNRLLIYRSRLLSSKKYESLSYTNKLKNDIKSFSKEKENGKEIKNIIVRKINNMIKDIEERNEKRMFFY